MSARTLTLMLLASVVLLYYATGIYSAVTMDTVTYVIPALTLFTPNSALWTSSRDLGYPLFLAPLLRMPWPALTITLAQLSLAVAAYLLLWRVLTASIVVLSGPAASLALALRPWLMPALAATALYSALHALIGAILPEVLLAGTALLAVICAQWFIRTTFSETGPLLFCAIGAVIPAAAAMTLKPHWLFSGAVLTLIIAVAAARKRPRNMSLPRSVFTLLALSMPVGVTAGAVVLNRAVVHQRATEESLTFGARVAFCNNAHLIDGAVRSDPDLRLADDGALDGGLKRFLSIAVPPSLGQWGILGFDGDPCEGDTSLTELLNASAASTEQQSGILTHALLTAALRHPAPFIFRVTKQMAYGVVEAFGRPAITFVSHPQSELVLFADGAHVAAFKAGTRRNGAAGLFAYTDAGIKTSLARTVARAVLTIGFGILTAFYCVLVLATLGFAPTAWSRWDSARKNTFLLYLALPLGIILAHNLVVSLVHSFDIWRYSFNMFFVHLLFIFSALAFFAGEWVNRQRLSSSQH